jgi:predicted ester cyclase
MRSNAGTRAISTGISTLYDESIALHGYSEGPMAKSDVRDYYQALFGALSDMRLQIHQIVEDSSHVAARFVLTGRHTGELSGVPATGRTVTQQGMTIVRFANGRCIERWSVVDFLPVLVQIGALPPPS